MAFPFYYFQEYKLVFLLMSNRLLVCMYKLGKGVVQQLKKASREVGQIKLHSHYLKSGDVTKIKCAFGQVWPTDAVGQNLDIQHESLCALCMLEKCFPPHFTTTLMKQKQ